MYYTFYVIIYSFSVTSRKAVLSQGKPRDLAFILVQIAYQCVYTEASMGYIDF